MTLSGCVLGAVWAPTPACLPARQVRFQLERAQEGLQRQLLHAEGGLGVLEARLADAHSGTQAWTGSMSRTALHAAAVRQPEPRCCAPPAADAEALRQRVALEQARVGELEGLLAIARADQFKRDAVAAEGGPDRQVASLREQRRLLEEQVGTLQRQVDGLVQRREEQDEELGALRARLAGEWDAGAATSSRHAQQAGAALAEQLAEARRQCVEYAEEIEELRAQAAALASARDGADAELQAAQAELADAKALLVAQGGEEGRSSAGTQPAEAAARLAQLEAQNRELSDRLEALAAGAGQHAASAAGLDARLEEVQQVRVGWGCVVCLHVLCSP